MLRASALFLGLLVLAPSAHASECDNLKKDYTAASQRSSDSESTKAFLEKLKVQVDASDACAQNILGRGYFDGILIPKDREHAIAIFNDLSDRGYPPAMYNLAFALIKEGKGDPETILMFIHGIMYKFYGTREWGKLASDARELGWDYLDSLEQTGPQPKLRAMQTHASDENVLALAIRVQEKSNSVHREIADITSVMTVLAIGAALNNMATPQCTWTSCKPFLSTGELYNIGIIH